MNISTLAIFTILVFLCIVIQGQTLANLKQLYTDVFSTLQKGVIPNDNPANPLQLTVGLSLLTIIAFKEVEETIVVTGGLLLQWTDGGISWNPASYGNLQSIVVSQDDIWIPQMVLINSVESVQPIQGEIGFFATVSSTGLVAASFGGVLSAKCKPDVSQFPLDTQSCKLQFVALNLIQSFVNLTRRAVDPVDISTLFPHSDWDLISYSSEVSTLSAYSMFEVELNIKRKPLYYIMMIVLPTFLFGLLNPLVFILPVESGERVGLAMTILLSYAIFLTLVSSSIPATSNPMSSLLIMMVLVILISGVIVFLVIVISSLYYRDESHKMHTIWKFIATRLPLISKETTAIKPVQHEKETECPGPTESWISKTSWKDVCHALDRLCLISFYSIIIIIIFSFIIALTA